MSHAERISALETIVNRHDDFLEKIIQVEVHVATVVEKVDNAHKRLDEDGEEIKSLRTSRHEHSNMLQNHAGILSGMDASVKELTAAVTKITQIFNKALWMFMGGASVGVLSLTVLGYLIYYVYQAIMLILGVS